MSVVATIADAVERLVLEHPTRVGIDGRSAAGKTTFADSLAEELRARGRAVLRASIDDFHKPGHKFRSMAEAWTPQTYYDDGYDYAAFVALLLAPLGPGGTRRCRPALFDSYHDAFVSEQWLDVRGNTVAVIDGAFLSRPELASHWDYLVWLRVDFETMIERARRRDTAWVGDAGVVAERYRRRVLPTHELYEQLVDPAARADAVIDTRDLDAPTIVRLAR
jgi:uridine kinase